MKIQFEAGTGRHFDNVNFMIGKVVGIEIYAEVEVPEGTSEDYGYLTMKKAITEAVPGLKVDFWYDRQEQYLAKDASADCEVYLDIQMHTCEGCIWKDDFDYGHKCPPCIGERITIRKEISKYEWN